MAVKCEAEESLGLAFGERPRTSYMFSYLSFDFSSWQTAQVEVQMRCARHSWDLRRHCRRRVALYKMFDMYTRTCTRTSIHTDTHEEVTKRCDCPGRITRGRCTYSQAASSVMGNKHAREELTRPHKHTHTAGSAVFVGPQRAWNFQGPPLAFSPADEAPYSRQSPAGGVRVLNTPGRS